jgi:hypothetical protein
MALMAAAATGAAPTHHADGNANAERNKYRKRATDLVIPKNIYVKDPKQPSF